jgi:lysophospholipase L1-like esterase
LSGVGVIRWRRAGAVGLVALALLSCGGDDGGNDGAEAPDEGDAASTTTAVADFGSAEESFTGSGPTVVILGDSLVVQARDRLHELLDTDHSTKIAAYVGEGLGGGSFTAALGADEPAMQTIAADYEADGADVLVLALGTNDAWRPELGVDDAVAGIDEIVARFPGACVVGVEVNPWSEAPSYDPAEADAITVALAEVADVMVPSLTPEQTADDQIHPNDDGREALASGIADAVRGCGAG